MRNKIIFKLGCAATAGVLAFGSCQGLKKENSGKNGKPNILFIMVDDLRPQLGCYGNKQMKTPNMDRLAEEGTLFARAYCNVPVCGASRASLLSGLRPTNTRFLRYDARKDMEATEVSSLPQHFKDNGYTSVSVGKIFHHPDDALESWTEIPVRPDYPNSLAVQEYWRDYQSIENKWIRNAEKKTSPLWDSRQVSGPAWENAGVHDSVYQDGKIALTAVQKLKELAKDNQPFFLGVGFIKPHLPFNAPKKYWDLYSKEDIRLAENPFLPKNAPDAAYHNFEELRSYSGIPREGPLADSTAFRLVHGYYAATSYVDAQVGRVLDELHRLKLGENTVVILMGDHGWQLGEHGLWCKHSTFDNAIRTPVILKTPQPVRHKKIEQLVEFIDIYPTLCELAGIEKPAHLDGDSWMPLLQGNTRSWKEVIYARYTNADAVVTPRYIYTEWHDQYGELSGKMMYDHQRDPGENENIVDDKKYKQEYKQLKQFLNNRVKDYTYETK